MSIQLFISLDPAMVYIAMGVFLTMSLTSLCLLHFKNALYSWNYRSYHISFFVSVIMVVASIYVGNKTMHHSSIVEGAMEISSDDSGDSTTNVSVPMTDNKLPIVQPPDSAAVMAARVAGFVVRPVSIGSSLLEVSSVNMTQCRDEELHFLAPFTENIFWLHLSGSAISDRSLQLIAKCIHLQKLDLKNTGITDASAAALAKLEELEILNLVGTKLGNEGLSKLKGLKNIKSIYSWQTQITATGISEFRQSHPDVRIEQ